MIYQGLGGRRGGEKKRERLRFLSPARKEGGKEHLKASKKKERKRLLLSLVRGTEEKKKNDGLH